MKKDITLTISGTDIRFNMTPDIYSKYIDEVSSSKKVAPTKNMLMRAVHPDDKGALKPLLEMPSNTMQIADVLLEKYSPDIDITVGE